MSNDYIFIVYLIYIDIICIAGKDNSGDDIDEIVEANSKNDEDSNVIRINIGSSSKRNESSSSSDSNDDNEGKTSNEF